MKVLVIVAVIAVVVVGVVGALYYYGDSDVIQGFSDLTGMTHIPFADEPGTGVDDPAYVEPAATENPEFDNHDIYVILCALTDKTLDRDETYVYIDELNMEVHGTDTDYVTVYGDYTTQYQDAGWTLERRDFLYPPTGGGVFLFWSKVTTGAAQLIGTTDAMTDLYGYETLVLTSNGSLVDYYAFANFVEAS